jgi:hypothetical protein
MPRVVSRYAAFIIASVGLCAAAGGPFTAFAQTPEGVQRAKTRDDLVRMALVADSLGRKEEAFSIRARLRDGDFEVGDRIVVSYEGAVLSKLNDTLIVQDGRIVRMGEPMGDLVLNGVLRSELKDSIAGRIAKYFKNETVHVTPLLRLAISGAVKSAGFYYARPDMPLSDVIMRTGGQDPTADLSKVEVKRGVQVLWHKQDMVTALANGLTLEGLDLESGDEVVVGAKSSNHWITVLQYGVPLLTATVLELFLRRR